MERAHSKVKNPCKRPIQTNVKEHTSTKLSLQIEG